MIRCFSWSGNHCFCYFVPVRYKRFRDQKRNQQESLFAVILHWVTCHFLLFFFFFLLLLAYLLHNTVFKRTGKQGAELTITVSQFSRSVMNYRIMFSLFRLFWDLQHHVSEEKCIMMTDRSYLLIGHAAFRGKKYTTKQRKKERKKPNVFFQMQFWRKEIATSVF